MNYGILYAPGLGKDLSVLAQFRAALIKKQHQLNIVDFSYDKGELEPQKYKCVIANSCDWWIGISLGASLLYYMVSYVPHKLRPRRLTIINPFSDRYQLSLEKGFFLDKQWNFSPKQSICEVENLELVSSIYDTSIPTYHGLELLHNAKAGQKTLITIRENHQIQKIAAQQELAELLLSINKEPSSYGKYNYCDLYKWQGNI